MKGATLDGRYKVPGGGREIYLRITGKKQALIGVACVVIVVFFFLDLMTGPSWLTVSEVITALLFHETVSSANEVIVWDVRLPVALMALIVGASLGIAGAEMQAILDNPLADPYTLGISSAAGLGASLAIVLGVGVTEAGVFLVPLNAFVFSFFSSIFIYYVAKTRSSDKGTIVLTGIALLFLFQSSIALLQYMASNQQMAAILFWMFGSLSKATLANAGICAAIMVALFAIFASDAWKLTALKLGDNKAKSLGIDVEGLRRKSLICVSLITATAVSFVGTIGFIGLVGPHIARLLVGDDQRFYLPLSALMGAMLLSIASTLSKIIMPGSIFPIGIVTSFIGVPFFLSLILKRKKGGLR
jgi:iron complex transport system permease protein